MLTEIYCASFGNNKQIPFYAGLNVIQGYAGESDADCGNSIGKTSMLKIIDFAFGGKYYTDSNEDVIRHVGHHDICFTHTFSGTPHYFSRSTTSPGVVIRCSDSSYTPQSEQSVADFCAWLIDQYALQNYKLSFRELVGLYSRIWNKPNKEVNRPLYNYNSQSVRDSIMSLVKLFDEYDPISELNEHAEYLRKRSAALSKATSFHLIDIPEKKEAATLEKKLTEIQEKIAQLKAIISRTNIENAGQPDGQEDALLDKRLDLLTQHGHITRAINRCARNLQRLTPINETMYSQLLEYFPEINIQRIQEVQAFHSSLRDILAEELNDELARLQKQLDEITFAIHNIEEEIQTSTGLSTQISESLEQLLQLTKQQEQIQNRLSLYHDKVTDTDQAKDAKKSITQLLGQITERIQSAINKKISDYSHSIATSNNKPPVLYLSEKEYKYGVEDNTGTGKAYTDLLLFDLAVLSLTKLPILIHDSFLFNNIDNPTKQSFLKLYSQFTDKQIFIALDEFLGQDNEEINQILFSSTRLVLSGRSPLFGIDWRTSQ